ncbi:hypothetical protein B0H67DRAFT_677608 [Lasiosphaeris hirsuta]|uniref:Uncharacterized protein n=1 Tax=Lasiosphaeris hirsuta TaxID=260670 RepID=A0AA40B8H6_9PEZI|nr:hypothetical protein B0H67DRAFT_677608 [Lasiosphaeris hirsuta]
MRTARRADVRLEPPWQMTTRMMVEAEPSQNAWDPQGYFADHHFSEEELEIIEPGWATFENFMLSLGLKFHKGEDFRKAKAIMRGIIDHEKDNGTAY